MFVWLKTSVLLDKANMATDNFMSHEIVSEDGRSLPPIDPDEYESSRIEAEKAVQSLLNHLAGAKLKI